ncbi:MAG: hypothetical protein ACOCXG_00705 [Nanoarchaeota archaeon]
MKLIHNKKVILPEMKKVSSFAGLGRGLTFTRKKTGERGLFMDLPKYMQKSKKRASLTNLFVFYSIDCLFLDENLKVVDKTTMHSFQLSYTPKKECRYIIESIKNKFKDIKIGDKIQIK